MRVTVISDTHQWHDWNPPESDVLVHAGDACLEGNSVEFEMFAAWWNKQPHKHKIFVPGNHDWFCQRKEDAARACLPGTHFLIDQECVIEGKRFWGSPYTPEFFNWAYNVPRGKLYEHWNKIPQGLDVLVTHGPPRGILDQAKPMRSENVGDLELRYWVEKAAPKLHVFGHIHGSGGRIVKADETTFFNASVVTELYNRVRGGEIFEI